MVVTGIGEEGERMATGGNWRCLLSCTGYTGTADGGGNPILLDELEIVSS